LYSDVGYRGLLAYTLPEALWLDGHGFRNIVVAYPSSDRTALRALAARTASAPHDAPVIMVDSVEHLDLIDRVVGQQEVPLRVCLDIDASFRPWRRRFAAGLHRSPVHSIAEAERLAAAIVGRANLTLVGVMCYEGHIAGRSDVVQGRPMKTALVGAMKDVWYREVRRRRGRAVEAIRHLTELEFVNAGGTGDLDRVASEPAITEATAGSGFYAPTLVDAYSFGLEPAAMFALPVSRRPAGGTVTALGGGYVASGRAGRDRMPTPYLPVGLQLDPLEGAGEVQTPLHGCSADRLAVGDKIFLRHAKAGELCERFDRLYLIAGERLVEELPTYRGEGKTFL
jgi:D-serine deaminase-like pyridoxal phosphate-dependent protein